MPDTENQSNELDDDIATQHEKIASQLSELSQAEMLPSGYSSTVEPFDPSVVDFEADSWLLQALQIQAWLHLNQDVSVSSIPDDPKAHALKMFEALGYPDPPSCISTTAGYVQMTPIGIEALSSHLDRATRLYYQFVELSETLNRKQATDHWLELWEEEEGEQEETETERIQAITSVWPIQNFSGHALKGRLNLNPSYQRGDVWSTADSQKLIESVLRGIPLPSVILLKPRGGNSVYEVVDGKQRLTAILRFIGKHPDALQHVDRANQLHPEIDFKTLFHSDYKKFKKLWKRHVGETLTATAEKEYYFPFRLPGSFEKLPGKLSQLAGKYYCEISQSIIDIGSSEELVEDLFETVCEQYKIPVIVYDDAAPRQIHYVFSLYNRQGKHLNAEEIRNALFHELDLMKLFLATSGDYRHPSELAPYLPQDNHFMMVETAQILTEYKFGISRYKRTKMLSWLVSLAFHNALTDDGELAIRSTAKHIDSFLNSVHQAQQKQSECPFLNTHTLTNLIADLHIALDAHSSTNCWAKQFRDDKDGTKWQELQLVASLLPVFLATLVVDDPVEFLEDKLEAIVTFTNDHLRPQKTQNKTQWGFIGEVSIGILSILDIPLESISNATTARYSTDPIPTLKAAKLHYVERNNN